MGVDFDKFYTKSDPIFLGKDNFEEGLSKVLFFKKIMALFGVDLTAERIRRKLVLRVTGTSVYITQDMGTADLSVL